MWKIIAINTNNSINFEARARESLGPYRLGITLFEMLISLESTYIKHCRELVSIVP